MSNVLKADATVAEAYVEFDFFGSPHAEVWLTYKLAFDATSLAFWTANGSQPFAATRGTGAGHESAEVAFANPGSFSWILSTADSVAASVAANTWVTCELHAKSDGTVGFYFGGSLVVSGVYTNHTTLKYVEFGQTTTSDLVGSLGGVAYIDDVKVGTTRGASNIFADNFETGNLSAWSSTTGTVSVVSDPFTAAPPPCRVEVAFGQDALTAAPTYTEIGSSFTAVSTHRGRQYLTDRTEAGAADLAFVDATGELDPTNSGGAFYPMDPNAPARVSLRNAFTNLYVPIFTGLTQGCPQTVRAEGAALNRGSLPLVDLFSMLAIAEVPPGLDFITGGGTYTSSANTTGNTSYPEESVQDRIKAVLADAGVPSALTDIFSGNVNVQQVVYSPGYTILAVIQDAADAEFPGVANVFVDKYGVVAFRGRLSRSDTGPGNPYGVNTWQAGDQAAVTGNSNLATVALNDLVIDRDVAKVINNALFTPLGIADADVAGQLQIDSAGPPWPMGPRALTGQSLVNAGATAGTNIGNPLLETAMFGDFYVGNFKAAHTRISQATFRQVPGTAANAEAHWNLLCNAEIGDILAVTVAFPSGAGLSAEQYFIEGISYTILPGGDTPDVTMVLDLSPVYTYFPATWDPNA